MRRVYMLLDKNAVSLIKHKKEDDNDSPPSRTEEHPLAVLIENLCGLKEIYCDEDGLYDGLIMPPEQHWIFWYSSLVGLATPTYALLCGFYDYALVSYGVAATSLNYWRRPMYDWRRTIDITFVCGGLCYHISKAIYSEFAAIYFSIVTVGIFAYGLSVYTHKKSSWLSTLFHIIVHICANSSNCVLYTSMVLARQTIF